MRMSAQRPLLSPAAQHLCGAYSPDFCIWEAGPPQRLPQAPVELLPGGPGPAQVITCSFTSTMHSLVQHFHAALFGPGICPALAGLMRELPGCCLGLFVVAPLEPQLLIAELALYHPAS